MLAVLGIIMSKITRSLETNVSTVIRLYVRTAREQS